MGMPMVPLYMSSRQPHPTRYEAKPPSSHVPMQHQSFAKPPSLHPSMPATSLPINQLSHVPNTIQLNKHLPPTVPKKRSRLSSYPPTRGVNQLIEVDHPEGVHHVNQETPAASAHTHSRWVPPPSHARALVQERRQSTHRPMVLPRVVVL